MKKKLVEVKNLDSFVCKECSTIYVDKTMILTSGAKDKLREGKIKIVYGEMPEPSCCEGANSSSLCTEDVSSERFMLAVAATLKEEYGINDLAKLKDLSTQIVSTIKNNL